jgi:hypothetical protein
MRLSMILRQSAIGGALFYGLGLACDARPAVAQAEPRDQLREMPKSGDDSELVLPEQLPPPHEVQSETIVPDELYLFRPPTRINRYEVWQLYEVDRYGGFRPRVIYSPYGSYYLYDGRPFPWISTHQRDFAPRLIGP